MSVVCSPTFNIADLKPYLGEEDELESRTTQMQEGEDDEDIPTVDTTAPTHTTHPQQVSQGPLTRARARQFKLSSWTQNTVLRSIDTDSLNFCVRTRIGTFFGSLES